MTIPWMQNDDFGSVNGRVEDHRCKIEPFYLGLCRSCAISQELNQKFYSALSLFQCLSDCPLSVYITWESRICHIHDICIT